METVASTVQSMPNRYLMSSAALRLTHGVNKQHASLLQSHTHTHTAAVCYFIFFLRFFFFFPISSIQDRVWIVVVSLSLSLTSHYTTSAGCLLCAQLTSVHLPDFTAAVLCVTDLRLEHDLYDACLHNSIFSHGVVWCCHAGCNPV